MKWTPRVLSRFRDLNVYTMADVLRGARDVRYFRGNFNDSRIAYLREPAGDAVRGHTVYRVGWLLQAVSPDTAFRLALGKFQ